MSRWTALSVCLYVTGRNHQAATVFPGNTGQRPNSVALLAEMLQLNGHPNEDRVSTRGKEI